jgi:chromosome segregation protein
MHLKEIELYGFKSFGERVKIEFNPRLTAIVGPNGSGKSNIVDSIRWLLGDQSYKSLRVPSSSEVIFKGAENDAPFNFSHVGMVVDLEDEGEFQIERKFHRSGENEYVLNGKVVRLKDIRSLLSTMGFGLGSLSILSQGQIDSILSLVPTDRRAVLEEVAQISHFKENKLRMLKKLDSTRENLNRIEDIIREIETRISELSEQAESARKFRELDNRRNELQLTLTFKETERLIKNIRKNLNFERELEKSRVRSLEMEKERSAMELAKSELDSRVEKREAGMSSIRRIESEIADLLNHIADEQGNLDKSCSDHTDADNRLNETLKQNQQIIENENSQLDEIEHRQTNIAELKGEIDLSHGRITMLEDRLTRSTQYLEEGEEAFNDRSSELDRLATHTKELDAAIEKSSEEITKVESQKEQAQTQYNNTEDEIKRTQSELSSLKEELISVSSELRFLMDLERKLAGYHTGVKRLIEADRKGELQGVIGPVVDLLNVDEGFEKALESILAGRGQYVIVESFRDGLNALEFLKKTSGGRVTFIPMDDFKPDNHQHTAINIPESEGYLGKALDRIKIDERFTPVIEHLLRDALVFTNLESARDARNKYNLKQWIVTLDGDVHRPKGIFTGGLTSKHAEGPLVRRSQIEQLETRKRDAEIAEKTLIDRLNSAKSLSDDHLRNITALEDEISSMRESSNDSIRERRYIKESIGNLEKEVTELRGKKDKIENEILSITSEIVDAKKSTAELEKNLDSIAAISDGDDTLKDKILQDRSLREDEINRLRILISSKEQEKEFIKTTISNLEDQHQNLLDEIEEQKSLLLDNLSLEEDAQARYVKLKCHVDMENAKLDSETSSEDNLRKQIELKREQLHDSRENASLLSAQIAETDIKRETQSVRIVRMETELVSFLKDVANDENIKNEYPNLLDTDSEDFNRFLESEFIDNLPPRKQLVDEIKTLTDQIDEIGEVNILAERDHENQQRRKEFLYNQRTDIVNSADKTMQTLAEIENESKKNFKEVFDQAKINFEEIFHNLFPEGKAELSLSDPSNLLESGLDIRVKFPGKKELDLLQFSGGERSIIAIIFLFSILKTKPPSFVILDEVEAALDDINVDKFIKLMRQFSDKFQFIIVTHNKLTMEYAGDLWGVTMKKGGMSQVVSISIDDWLSEYADTLN